VADEVSTGELARRLDEIVRLLQGLVSRVEYTEYQRHVEHRFTELEHDILEKRHAHDEDMRELRTELNAMRSEITKVRDSGGVNFRQSVYSGLIPAILLLVTLLVGFLQIKGK
jgi:hypothetical protein